MKILVTGASGFAGTHLINQLTQSHPTATILGTCYQSQGVGLPCSSIQVDLCDEQAVFNLLESFQPDQIYHLAGQSSVGGSFRTPWTTYRVNIRAQLNLCEACIALGIRPRMLVTISGDIYGLTANRESPLTENSRLEPISPYAVSKATQDMMAAQYSVTHGLPIIRVRPFNHIGPGQGQNFVVPDFASQIVKIEAERQSNVLRVGNLTVQRDFTDVRDVVQAYHLLMIHGKPGDVYHVASNQAVSIGEILDTMRRLTQADIVVEVDETRFRVNEIPVIRGSYEKLTSATGWRPMIPLEQTLADVLATLRNQLIHSEQENMYNG